MSSYHAQVQNLHYNAATQSFEAIVALHEGSDTLKFPCSLEAPIEFSFEWVARRLVAQAKAARKRGAQHMVSRSRVAARKRAATSPTALARDYMDTLNLPGPVHAA